MHLDIASILALALIGVIVFLAVRNSRGGPGLDRAIVKENARLKDRVAAIEAGLGGCATKADVAALSGKIDALEEYAASAGDINALEGKVNVALAKIEGVEKSAERTARSVERLEDYFIGKGIGR